MRAVVVMIVLMFAGLAAADGGGKDVAQRIENIKKRIRIMRANEITEQLSLDETTATKLFPLLAKYDDETDKLVQRRAELAKKLAAADDLKDGKAVDKLLDDAAANQRSFWDLEDRRLAELRKVLTPKQVAKLLIVLPPWERKIQNQLRNAIQKQAARKGRNDDEDDER